MDDIRKIGHNTWLVHGKVIGCKDDGLFDDSTPEGRAVMIDVADNTCNSPVFPRRGQPLYAAYFRQVRSDIGGRFLLANQPHFGELPEDIRAELRKEFPQHATEF